MEGGTQGAGDMTGIDGLPAGGRGQGATSYLQGRVSPDALGLWSLLVLSVRGTSTAY
jgi:hypothetical protein